MSLKGYDIVSASSHETSWLISLFYKLFNYSSLQHEKIQFEMFRVLSRRAINRCLSIVKSVPYRKVVYANCGLKMTALYYDTKKFKKELDAKQIDTAINAVILFTSFANKLMLFLIICFMSGCLFSMIYALTFYLNGKSLPRWTTIMLFLSISFMALFVSFGIMMKYLSIILNLVFKNKNYIMESVEKLTK